MKKLQIYDPPMCCSTGVCGPNVDRVLERFTADLKWLEARGVTGERFDLAQTPIAFAENEVMRAVTRDFAWRTAIVPWVPDEPVGPAKLQQLFEPKNSN